MHDRRIPEWLRHAPAPSVRGFAVLAGAEAIVRGTLVSVFPLVMHEVLQDASVISKVYFFIGMASLTLGLLIPFVIRFVPRRWVYVAGTMMYILGAWAASGGAPSAVVFGLTLITCATVTTFVCFNAYILDYVSKIELGKFETSRLFYSAMGWTIGPILGVFLHHFWRPAPFLLAGCGAMLMAVLFLVMRLGNGKLIAKSRKIPAYPFAFLGRFAAQPRLIIGWLFAVIRSCGWWIYIVYLPIFAVENGLGTQLGGIVLSISNGALFLTPLMFRFLQYSSVRTAIRTGFFMSGLLFVIAAGLSPFPLITVLCLALGSLFLILLDVSAGLPFLLAVKPSERTEMSAIYSSFRDVSGIVTPGMAWLILLAAPIQGIFMMGGLGLLGAGYLAGKLHPRLGGARVVMQGVADDRPIDDWGR